MSEAAIIVTVMVVMFGGIYFYVYGGEKIAQMRASRAAKRKKRNKENKEARIKSEIAAKQAARKEFYEGLRERSEEIKRELKRLEQSKETELS